MELDILVPVLGRPHRVRPLVDSIRASLNEHARILFLCDVGDKEEIKAVRAAIGRYDYLVLSGANYAAKINTGVRATLEPYLFIAADDLDFRPGWYEAAKAHLTDGVQVVGVNDLLDRSRLGKATHFLVTREYAERPTIDGGPGPLHEGYDHSWVDDELVATAEKRGVYAYAEDSHVRHLHPMNGSAPDDEVYVKGRSRFREDHKRFRRRRRLWM